MVYAAATLPASTTAARDMMAALNAPLTSAGFVQVDSYQSPASANWTGITYGGGLFVTVCATTSTAATSPDGITWTARTLPAIAAWRSVTYGNGMFVAVAGAGTTAASSPDGITWTLRTLPTSSDWSSVAYGNGTFVALTNGVAPGPAATSPDGITWTARTTGVTGYWTSLTYGNGLFLAVNNASSPTFITSPDGITWTTRAAGSNPVWGAVTYGAGLYVVTTNQGTNNYSTSPNATTWTARTFPASGYFTSITYGGGLFAVTTYSTTSNTVLTSPDGITWTARNLPYTTPWQQVAYGGGQFAALSGSDGLAARSTDGITWTAQASCGTSITPRADVYKSPAAANLAGKDWYLILRRTGDAGVNVVYQVCEQYDPVTHRAAGYGGLSLAVLPVPGTGANPGPPMPPDQCYASTAWVTVAAAGTPYWYSITANRVIVATKPVTELGFYAGLYEDVLPAGTTKFPLVCARLPWQTSATGAIGNNAPGSAGGFTRDPGPVNGANAAAFDAAIHSGWTGNTPYPAGLTPVTTTAALYGNVGVVSRVLIGTARTNGSGAIGDSVRGLLYDCVVSAITSAAGDTVTAGGKTYVRFAGPTTTYGIFVDQGV